MEIPDHDQNKLEGYARNLEATGEFKVLRRIDPFSLSFPCPPGPDQEQDPVRGVILDVETTGLNPASDEVIELAMIPFTASSTGHVIEVERPISLLREPSAPIPERITRLTGITSEMVMGKTIDQDYVGSIIADTDLVIAHVARFDRSFAELLHPDFANKPWACSQSQVPWEKNGFDSTKLTSLAHALGWFYGAHRALDDCAATLKVLTTDLPETGGTALSHVLKAATTDMIRLWAEGSPYHKKDILHARQYRWNDGTNGQPKAWWIEIPAASLMEELDFLHRDVFGRFVQLPYRRITARDRFTLRA